MFWPVNFGSEGLELHLLTVSHSSVGHIRMTRATVIRTLRNDERDWRLPERARHLALKMLKPFNFFFLVEIQLGDECLDQGR